MLISYEHQFVFVKTRKTAGTSIEIALSRHMGARDVITRFGPEEDEVLREQCGGRGPQNEGIPRYRWRPWHWVAAAQGKEIRYFHHMPARSIRRFVGRARWNQFVTFAVARNPWDLAVSAYHWHYRDGRREPESFESFILSDAIDRYRTWPTYASGNRIIVDEVLRYERLASDLRKISELIGLPTLTLPRAKSKQRADRRPYQEWHTPATRDRIAEVFDREIDHFGWVFPDDLNESAGDRPER